MVDTAVELEPGKTVVMSGLSTNRKQDEGEEVALLVTFRVDLCDEVADAQPQAAPLAR